MVVRNKNGIFQLGEEPHAILAYFLPSVINVHLKKFGLVIVQVVTKLYWALGENKVVDHPFSCGSVSARSRRLYCVEEEFPCIYFTAFICICQFYGSYERRSSYARRAFCLFLAFFKNFDFLNGKLELKNRKKIVLWVIF